jgi:hypothetical protein
VLHICEIQSSTLWYVHFAYVPLSIYCHNEIFRNLNKRVVFSPANIFLSLNNRSNMNITINLPSMEYTTTITCYHSRLTSFLLGRLLYMVTMTGHHWVDCCTYTDDTSPQHSYLCDNAWHNINNVTIIWPQISAGILWRAL